MITDATIKQVQVKLNRLSIYVLGCILSKCGKDDFGRSYRSQVLLAMAPEFDGSRLSDDQSFSALSALANGRWL